MTYKETLYALLKETEKTTIFALNSFGDAEIGIGFRRACTCSDLKDPHIDGNVFMLCADAWDKSKQCPILTTLDLMRTQKEDIRIMLRAVSGFPYTETKLGCYHVTNIEPSGGTFQALMMGDYAPLGYRTEYPQFIRLDIERD